MNGKVICQPYLKFPPSKLTNVVKGHNLRDKSFKHLTNQMSDGQLLHTKFHSMQEKGRTPIKLNPERRAISFDPQTLSINTLRSIPEGELQLDIKKPLAKIPSSDIKPIPKRKKCFGARAARISDIIQGALARFLFLCHSCVGSILVIAMAGLAESSRYLILLTIGPQVIETFITLVKRRGREWRWVTPCILFHIMASVPAIWVLELTEVEKRLAYKRSTNETYTCQPIDPTKQTRDEPFKNFDEWSKYMITEFCNCGNCIQIMVQLLLLLLVVGRWLCPRSGTVSMAQKAVMLFHNFAVTSDILDLFRLLKEETVNMNPMLVTVTLCLWTSGIMQIGIVVTERKKDSKACGACLENGVWAILAVLLLDDIPFLIFRFVLIIYYKVFSYTIFFFTCKNLLLTALNTNKLVAIALEHKHKVKAQKRADLYRPAFDEVNKSSAVVKIRIPEPAPAKPSEEVTNSLITALH